MAYLCKTGYSAVVIIKKQIQHINQCGTGSESVEICNLMPRFEKLYSAHQAYFPLVSNHEYLRKK